ncbi:uncharacterized protein LOC141848731 [Curcuma longa]|uniref:uncharacterized protein LOC141848731 n=1 Tax=Curcuma longa TaxID=136217 RepID=UPI003D9DC286
MAQSATAAAASVVNVIKGCDARVVRGEFAAANAIIDELCGHLAQIGGADEYEVAFAGSEASTRRALLRGMRLEAQMPEESGDPPEEEANDVERIASEKLEPHVDAMRSKAEKPM